jgi:hypothetical protein
MAEALNYFKKVARKRSHSPSVAEEFDASSSKFSQGHFLYVVDAPRLY